jgi:diguanylate cyclase (GGDEF)-like protein/PAS domain S-box-containing protein
MKRTRTQVFLGIAAIGVFVWVGDAVIDSLVFEKHAFLDSLLFGVTAHELYFRSFFIIVYSVAAAVMARILYRRREADQELRKHLAAVESSMDGIAIFNAGHEYVYVNDAYVRITGHRSAGSVLGKSFRMIYDDRQVAWIEANVFPVLERGERWHGELPARRKDGTPFLQEATITRLPDRSCICVMRDVTDRKRKEEELRRSERFLSSIFDSIHDPFCILDRDFRIVRANTAYAELKEKGIDDIIHNTCYRVLEGRDSVCQGCIIHKTFQSGDPCAKEKKIELNTGETLWLEIYTYPLRDEQGELTHVIEYTRDVTDRKLADAERRRLIDRLEHLSKVDGLTGLLNRRALADQLSYEIDRARRYGSDLSVVLCDMDNLKDINDTHGHLAGDMAVQVVASTLRSTLRSVDIAGRYGGDEFLVIPQTAIDGARNIAEKIQAAMQAAEVQLTGGGKLGVSVSIGITVLGGPDDDLDSLIQRVDTALYDSKSAGRNRITAA